MLRPSAFSGLATLLFALLLTPLRGFESRQATNQDQLFKLIGYGSNSIMALGRRGYCSGGGLHLWALLE